MTFEWCLGVVAGLDVVESLSFVDVGVVGILGVEE